MMTGSFLSSVGRGFEALIFKITNETRATKAIPAAM
jgi:hypothetical protein